MSARGRLLSGMGDRMTIPFEQIKAELLAHPEVKAEYDALAPEFEALASSLAQEPTHAAESPSSRRVVETHPYLAPKR